jgi:hypothetical protein
MFVWLSEIANTSETVVGSKLTDTLFCYIVACCRKKARKLAIEQQVDCMLTSGQDVSISTSNLHCSTRFDTVCYAIWLWSYTQLFTDEMGKLQHF